ncbi:MAG TPA: hypothetical protein VJ829_17570, partial [Candidatus Binatia bacterium]|nr:hypothetical protein [Candidatus Binatia bacterium]
MAERVGLRGKRSQSSLTEDEVARLREGLGLAQRPAVTVGSERVVAERVVTRRDSDADQLVTAIEQTTETRLRANVIRRRTAREVLKREELPPAVPEAEPAPAEIPPSLDFEPEIPPSVSELTPSADVVSDGAPVAAEAAEPVATEPEPLAEEAPQVEATPAPTPQAPAAA